MISSKKVLITGGAGLIGFTLAKKLLNHGYYVSIFDLKEQLTRRKKEINKLLSKYPDNFNTISGTIMDKYSIVNAAKDFNIVVHLAAMLGVRRTEDNKLQCLNININGTENVLNACIQYPNIHFILASSSEVYGEPLKNPVSEKDITQGKTIYAISKLAAEELVKGYAQSYPNLNYTIVRFFNTYGDGQVAQFVLSKFISRAREGIPPQVYGDGSQVRSFCHAEDATEAVRLIIENKKSHGKVYNVGNMSQKYSLLEAANLVIETISPGSSMKPKIIPFEDSDRNISREIFQRNCDCTKVMSELGYEPLVTLKQGVEAIAKTDIDNDWVI